MSRKRIAALVGNPNAGKSALFNALTGARHIDAGFVDARDRMLTDDRRRVSRREPFASDHYPVVATYVFGPGDAPDL